jgi:hypothetical protein
MKAPRALWTVALATTSGCEMRAALQFAEKIKNPSSGVETPNENPGSMSELKLRPPKKLHLSANCKAIFNVGVDGTLENVL